MLRFALLLTSFVALAGDETKPRPELPAAVRPIVGMARSAPPELFADTIVRLVELGKIPPRELQVELLTDAFNAAAGAREAVRLIGVRGTPPDTRAMYRGKAGELRWDALSLQSRILKAMLTLDRPKTRELFDHMRRPVLDPCKCEDPLVADASAYYEIAGALAQSAFSPAEKEKDVHVQFLLTALAGARSPNELAAFVRAVQSVNFEKSHWELLLGAIANKLENIGADYRPFAMSLDALQGDLSNLVDLGRAHGLPLEPLLRAFRKYLVTQFTAARCEPELYKAGPETEWLHGAIPALTSEEIQATVHKETFKADPYFESEESKSIGAALTRLRSAVDRATVEWRNSLNDFLRDFAGWRPTGSDMDVFHQKATVLGALLQLAPAGEDRDRIVDACVTFLTSSDAERLSPAEWMWQVKSLVDNAGADAPKMLQGFRGSGDAGLVLHASSQER